MMTSSNGNIFRVTGHLCGEFTGPAQRPVTRSFDVFFDLRLNKRLSKQSWGWWFETASCPLWRHRNVLVVSNLHSWHCWIWCRLQLLVTYAWATQRVSLTMDSSSLPKVSCTIDSRFCGHGFSWPLLRFPTCCDTIDGLLKVLAAWGMLNYGRAEGPPRDVEKRNLLSHPDDLRMEVYVIRMT